MKGIGMNLWEYIHIQKNWSVKTFGPGDRTAGLLDHIKKELVEIEETQGQDLEEWIDVIILALDGAWRSGNSPLEIITAMIAKQKKNKARQWPDWRKATDGKAIEHIR